MTAFEDIVKFVEETQKCECSYCNVKHKIQVGENCGVVVESGDEFILKPLE